MPESYTNKQLNSFLSPAKDKLYWALVWGTLSAVLTLACIGLLRIISQYENGVELAEFIYDTQYGYFYVYVLMTAAVMCIATLVKPSHVMFRELSDNRWYYLSRMGFSVAKLVSRRLSAKLLSFVLAYFWGLGLGFAACTALGIPFFINGLIALLLFGGTNLMLMLTCLLAVSALFKSKLAVRLFSLAYIALLAGYLHLNDCFTMTSRYDLTVNMSKLMYLDGLSFLLLAGALTFLMTILIYTCARDKSAFYTSSELKGAALSRLGLQNGEAVAIDGKNHRTIAEGKDIVDKKQLTKRETLIVTMGEPQKERALERNKRAQSRTPLAAWRVALAVVLALVVLVFAVVGIVSSFVSDAQEGKPAKVGGIYAVLVPDSSIPGVSAGERVLFKASGAPEQGGAVLFTEGEGIGYGQYTEGGEIAADDVLAKYFMKIPLEGILSDKSTSTVGIGAAALLFGLFLLNLIYRKKAE